MMKGSVGQKRGGYERKFSFLHLTGVILTVCTCLLAIPVASLAQLFQGPVQGTSASGAKRDTTTFTRPETYAPPEGTLVEHPIGRVPLVENPPDLLPPLAPEGTNEVDDPSAPKPEGPQPSAPNLVPGTSFKGLTDVPDALGFRHIPPDPIMAAGPNHLMGLVNSDFGIFNKSSTLQKRITATVWFQNVLPGLGSSPLGGGAFDPQVLYDHFDNRWIMVWLAQDDGTQQGWFLISVSDDSDPNGTWCNWAVSSALNGSTVSGNWSDYEGLGVDNQAIYLTGNQFRFSDGGFDYAKIRILNKTPLYNPSCPALNYTDLWDLRDPNSLSTTVFTVRPAVTFETPGVEYLMNDSPFVAGTFMTLWSLTNPLSASPTLTATDVPVTSSTSPPNANQLGGGTPLIDVGGRRTRNLVYRNGSVWTAHSIADSTGQFARARYVRINVSGPTLLEDASIGADNCWYYYPAITADASSNMYMVFNRSCTTEFAGIRYTGRTPTDTTIQASAELKAGEANYVKTFSGTRNRWGDYSGIAVDPSDTSKVWVFAEYAASPANTWGTWFGQLTFGGTSSTPTLSVSPSSQDFGSVTAGSSVDRTFTVSNTGGGTLTGSATTSAPFSVVSGGSFSLGASQNQTVTVRFSPTAAGIFGGTVTFSSNGGSASATVTGTGATGASYTEVPGGGLTSSSPAAVVEGSTLSLFVRGTNDRIYLNTRSGGSFGGWSEVPGNGLTPSQPAAVVDSSGNLRLYVQGVNNRIYVNVRSGGVWSGWSEVPGGGLTSSGPEAVLDGSLVRLFVRGTDDRIYTITP